MTPSNTHTHTNKQVFMTLLSPHPIPCPTTPSHTHPWTHTPLHDTRSGVLIMSLGRTSGVIHKGTLILISSKKRPCRAANPPAFVFSAKILDVSVDSAFAI